MSSDVVFIILTVLRLGLCETWYKGCYNVTEEEGVESVFVGSVTTQSSVAECARHCYSQRIMLAGVQLAVSGLHDGTSIQDAESYNTEGPPSSIQCVCINPSLFKYNNSSCDEAMYRSSTSGLPISNSADIWTVYSSVGPYLTKLMVRTDAGVAVIHQTLAIEIHARRASSINVIAENEELGHMIDMVWTIREDNVQHKEQISMGNFTEILHRPKYTFTAPGIYHIGVEISNGISSLRDSYTLRVVEPNPRGLQVWIQDEADLPSCIPEEYAVPETGGQIFSVFVGTSLSLAAGVSMGTNLTFTFDFEDLFDDIKIQPCGNCTSVTLEHTFEDTGIYGLHTVVRNIYGEMSKSVRFLVMDRQLKDLTIELDPESHPVTSVGEQIHFIVSMVTTSRYNHSLQVWYGDNFSNVFSLTDIDSPKLVLVGDGKEMEIVASYGEGCMLLVEFHYAYTTQGFYNPTVALYKDHSTSDSPVMLDEVPGSQGLDVVNGSPEFDKVTSNHSVVLDELTGSLELGEVDGNHSVKINELTGSLELDEVTGNHSVKLEEVNTTKNASTFIIREPELVNTLNYSVLVLQELSDIIIHAPSILTCGQRAEIHVPVSTMFNVSLQWSIYKAIGDLDFYDSNELSEVPPTPTDGPTYVNIDLHHEHINEFEEFELILDIDNSDTKLDYLFAQSGMYLISVKAQNAISTVENRVDLSVECPIEGLQAVCPEDIVVTGEEMTCYAQVQGGSHVDFQWDVIGMERESYIQSGNYSSIFVHRFSQPGIYDVELVARNNINITMMTVKSSIYVEDVITNFNVLTRQSRNLIGSMVALYKKTELDSPQVVRFVWDFGDIIGYSLCDDEHCLEACDHEKCFSMNKFAFLTTGAHNVTVHAYNLVSNLTKIVEIQVYPLLNETYVEVVNVPTLNSPTRLLVKENGKAMETADVYYTWEYGESSYMYFTNSPIVEVYFNNTGNLSAFLQITNPVYTNDIDVPVYVSPKTEVTLQLLHDLYVVPGSEVTFDLKVNIEGPLIGWTELHVTYGEDEDGLSEVYDGVTYQWKHIFEKVGTQQITATLVGSHGTSIETVTSYLLVQEPITDLVLTGPSMLMYEKYETSTWVARTSTGTNILYNWTLMNASASNSMLLTSPVYEIDIPHPERYFLHVEAFNDVTRQPLTASFPFLVHNVTEEDRLLVKLRVRFQIIGNLVGQATHIHINVTGHPDFVLEINYGDGKSETVYSYDPVVISTSTFNFKVFCSHIYTTPGEFNVKVNVSDDISSDVTMETFIPISNITLTTRSPRILRTMSRVTVRAVVTGGEDLVFKWNFSDPYQKPNSTKTNRTSIATHCYGMSGTYQVVLNVTGRNYPPPGVSVALQQNFLLVDPVEKVRLYPSQTSSPLLGNETEPILFNAKSSGSNVSFVFDYGDGTIEEIPGAHLSHMNVDMTMYADGIHSYTSVGEYKVKVVARNPLGNKTAELPASFWVQVPLSGLSFCDRGHHKGTSYSGKVGEAISMCVHVETGTNVTFDWKMGDQTDFVNQGPRKNHTYMSPGVRNVYVTARNHVNSKTLQFKVHVNYEIQSVEVVPQFDVISMRKIVRFTAVVTPNMTAHYNWRFQFSHGDVKKYSTTLNYVDHRFRDAGECTVTVTADNHINRMVSPTLDIFVHQPIRNSKIIIISNNIERLVNQPIKLRHIAYWGGSNVNLTWTFGDGSDKVVSNLRTMEHIYTSPGAYNVTLVVQNPVSMESVHQMLFILEEPYCVQPEVQISADSNTKLLYSRSFTMEADIAPDCNLTSNIAYHWSIDGHMTIQHYQMRNRILVLPPRALSYGFHTIQIKVDMVGTIVYATESITVEVIPSPLVANIIGGVYRRLHIEDAVVVNGSLSYDPDYDDNITIRYIWKCSYVAEDGRHGDVCIRDNIESNLTQNSSSSCNLSMNSSVLKITTECLVRASNYTFELTAYASGRLNGTTSQTLSLERESLNSLDVKIIRPYNTQDLVNSNRKLSFYVECSNCPQQGNVVYEWSVKYLAGYDIFDLARAHDAKCIQMDGSNYLALITNTTDEAGVVQDDDDSNVGDADNADDDDIDDDYGESEEREEDYYQSSLYEWDMVSSTSKPVRAFDGIFTEDIDNNRRPPRGRTIFTEDEDPTYLVVKENKESQRRDPRVNMDVEIGEEDNNAGLGYNLLVLTVKEGEPGESGSSGGRQYGAPETAGSDRISSTFDPNESEGLSSGATSLDAVVGDRVDPGRQWSQLELPMVQVNLPAEQTSTGLDRQAIVIKPGFLKQGLTYFVDVKVTNKDTGYQGEATSSFVVNKSPVHGRCSVKPDSGMELTSQFTIHCLEWRDQHQPLMFEASYSFEKNGVQNLIYRGVNDEFSFHLPAGKPQNDYNVYVYIALLDALLAKTTFCVTTIQVTPKTITDELGIEKAVDSDAKLIYDEVVSPNGALQKSIDGGNSALSKVYISYLATWLNGLNDSANASQQWSVNTSSAYSIETSNVSHSNSSHSDLAYSDGSLDTYTDGSTRETSKHYRRLARWELLKILQELSIRDEAELIQSAKALSLTTAVADELDLTSLDLALRVLKSVCRGAVSIYNEDLLPTGDLVEHVVSTSSAIIQGIMLEAQDLDTSLENMYKLMIHEAMQSVQQFVLNELKFHVFMEEPIISDTEYLSVWASRHVPSDNQIMTIGKTQFKVPSNLATNQNCLFSHMTSYKINPYGFKDRNKVQSVVGDLTLYNCDGRAINVNLLKPEEEIQIDLPNIQPKTLVFPDLILQKWKMNVHQFNVTSNNLHHALHIVLELVPVHTGRLFPISLLLSYMKSPSPDHYNMKYTIKPGEHKVDVFLPPTSLNNTGEYYIGIVDSTYNSGRLRPGEVTERTYTLKLWWGQCFYWNGSVESWLSDGCNISQDSTLEVTKCSCNHLTTFGGRFQLVPNKLSFTDMEAFFSPNKNPVTLILVSVILTVYCILLFLCYHADLHDNKKGGIVYLLDNSPMDQQKFEITVETGFWKGAGSTAKISIILHGEEGMSETRELISEDDRPLFERNSRDKFILSLPDSIGKIWKIQVWHNNYGPSPSWYLSTVIVRDLNTGFQYAFVCEKWLAVEEQDGKVEREFMVLDSALHFTKIYKIKAWEYIADYHVWLSLITCPPYSGFMRTERLTVCLTMFMAYMCLNATWYKKSVNEYRGEFGLLDLSWRNLVVGAICCAVVIPVGRFLEFLFRRSKPKHASSSHTKDEVSDWEPDYPSGKPNEQESEDSSEQVQPIMTYSLLDQSILNWPNIQTWAQKQWMKRQQSGRSMHDSHSGNSSNHSAHHHGSHGSNQPPGGVNSVDFSVLNAHGLSELDQASSGFEDCSSLIRPKASVDSTHTTAAPSVNESMRVHKPQSLPDSLRISTKLPSESDYVKTSKAPSISSTGSNKSSMLLERKRRRILQHIYLPYWCRYIAWFLCAGLCMLCATVTIMYGYRFGITKSTLWLQSLYFSMMICVFITNPILILLAVCYSAWLYRKDPNITDNYSYDIFNHEKAKQDLMQWKKHLESWDDGEALERGVAARQRSRYLRFARPPQEKQLIEARKQVLKERRALTLLRETVTFIVSLILLMIMAYGKDNSSKFQLNISVKNTFLQSGDIKFHDIHSIEDWYMWAQSSLLHSTQTLTPLHHRNQSSHLPGNNYMIGRVQLRQQRSVETPCSYNLPYVHSVCLSNTVTPSNVGTPDCITSGENVECTSYTSGFHGDFMFGRHGVYDGSGLIISLNTSRHEAIEQLRMLKTSDWLDRHTMVVIVELTLYNVQSNLFTAVQLLTEMSSTGVLSTHDKITSTQLFSYVTRSDNFLLACQLLFFVLMLLSVKSQALCIISERRKYFHSLWNNLDFLIALISLVFCACFIYRFVIVAESVENLRSSYYEKYISVSFIAFWDNILLSSVAILLFLYLIKSLRLLRFNQQFTLFGEVFRKARREILIFFGLFCIILAAYTSLGHTLFGCMLLTFSDLWYSLTGVTAMIAGCYTMPTLHNQPSTLAANIYMFTFCVFATGFLTCYMIAVLSHLFKVRKKRRLLAFSGIETVTFYWTQFELWTGLRQPEIEEEPVIILPPEFTMAEIEYQVDELLFRMNALTGSHGLPEKPTCYLTDSDCTYDRGDDGISSAGSETGPVFVDYRLEHRVQKIEDNLCSQEPFLAQLLKFDSIGADDLTQEKEKQLRSHLELEIFRQLQIQRQDLKSPSEESPAKGSNSEQTEADSKEDNQTPQSPGQGSTSSDEQMNQPVSKPTKPKRTRSSLKVQTLQDLITQSTHEMMETQENSSSNPDSPRDKLVFCKMNKPLERVSSKKSPWKHNSSSSSSEKISPDLSHIVSAETETIKKPTKPTFLHSRESSLSDCPKGSPILKMRTLGADKVLRSDVSPLGLLESSSGSEQDSLQLGKKLFGRRSLRKTKSRGKGKGPDSLEPALVLDEIEGEESVEVEMVVECSNKGDHSSNLLYPTKGDHPNRSTSKEHVITADVHHSS